MSDDTMAIGNLVSLVADKVTAEKDPSMPYIGLEHIPSNGSAINSYGSASDSISTNNVFRAGDTLFGKLRPQLRKCVRTSFDGFCSTDVLVLRAKDGHCSEFVSFVLSSEPVFAEAIRTEEGTKMPRCSWQSIKSFTVFCPALPQQRKIARILTTLDELIEKTESLITKYQVIKQGLMHDLFTRGVDEHGHLRPSYEDSPQLYKESELGWIPKEWQQATLAEISDRVVVGLALSTTHAYREHGVPLVRNQNIRRAYFEDFDMLYLDPHFAKLFPNKALRKGDVLTVRTGANVGDTAVVPYEYVGSLTFTTLITSPITGLLDSDFLAYYMLSDFGLSELNRLLVGGGKENLNVGEFVKLRLSLPSIEEQHQAMQSIEAIDAQIDAENRGRSKLIETKTGLMQDLLTGKVEVTVGEKEDPHG